MATSLFHTMLSAALKQETSLDLRLPHFNVLPSLGSQNLYALGELTHALSYAEKSPDGLLVSHFLLECSALFKKIAKTAQEKPLFPALRKGDHFSVGQDVYVRIHVLAEDQTARSIGFQKGVVTSVSNENITGRHPSVNSSVKVSLLEGLQKGEMFREVMPLCYEQVLSENEFIQLSRMPTSDTFQQYWILNSIGGGGPFELKKSPTCV